MVQKFQRKYTVELILFIYFITYKGIYFWYLPLLFLLLNFLYSITISMFWLFFKSEEIAFLC